MLEAVQDSGTGFDVTIGSVTNRARGLSFRIVDIPSWNVLFP